MYTIGPLKEVNMVLFLRNKRFNVMLFWADYYLRWWRLPIEERAWRKTDLGGGDYYLRNSGLPPPAYLLQKSKQKRQSIYNTNLIISYHYVKLFIHKNITTVNRRTTYKNKLTNDIQRQTTYNNKPSNNIQR